MQFKISFAVLALLPAVIAVGSPVGFATGTTGGAGGVTVTPTTNQELLNYLADSTARTIRLTKIFDFTSFYGTTTGAICKPWTCTNGFAAQDYINTSNNFCAADLPKTTATWNAAGSAAQYSLRFGSNKTLLGVGANAGVRGVGLTLTNNVSNIIIQNIAITDINARYVWGGDAITIAGASKVWIDHNYIARVGRQFIVTGYAPAQSITISNNVFDGVTSWSASCNGQHYWAFLIVGTADTITIEKNHIKSTSGRSPHIGAAGYQHVHLVNNYFDNIKGHALDIEPGAQVLVEGNYFNGVTTIDTGNSGAQYFVTTVAQAGTPCTSGIGRICEWNKSAGSGAQPANKVSASVMTALKAYTPVKSYNKLAVDNVVSYVTANAGVGKIN